MIWIKRAFGRRADRWGMKPSDEPRRREERAVSPLKSWQCFAFLIVTAIIYYYAGRLVLFVAAIVVILRVWWWAMFRFPNC